MSLTLIADGRDYTTDTTDLTYSTVDPGGFEACSFSLPMGVDTPAVGSPVRVMEGLATVWEGEVEDPGDTLTGAQVQAVGYGARLKDEPYRMVYVDRDLTRWTAPSVNRQVALLAGGIQPAGSFDIAPDPIDDAAVIRTIIQAPWDDRSRAEAWYDAGQGLSLAKLHYAFTPDANVSTTDTNWAWYAALSSDDQLSVDDITASLRAASGSGYVAASGVRRFAALLFEYLTAGPGNFQYTIHWGDLAVYGDHGLMGRGSDPVGFYATDIVSHALAQVDGIDRGIWDDASSLIVPHAVYRDPTPAETVIDDMGTLLGWHWGVWESANGVMGGNPRLDFRARPSSPTAAVSRRDCDNLQIGERRSQLYDACVVTYTDTAGQPGVATASLPNPRLTDGDHRTLGPLSLGVSSATVAQAFAMAALKLAQAAQRGGGSPTLPGSVYTPGGVKQAHTLRAGLDRLRITDLPNAGSTLDAANQFDTFRIRRTEVTLTSGRPVTTVELDEGADLLEVLQARMALNVAAATG